MAKRTTRKKTAATRAAESFGAALGTVAARVDSWLAQRDDIAKELNGVIGKAQTMLSSLGASAVKMQEQAASAATGVQKTVKKRARKMSKEARQKIAAAQKARWAKQKAAAKK